MIQTVRALKLSLKTKLQSAFEELWAECVKRDVIETDGVRYTYGPNWMDFVGEYLKFSERMFLAESHCNIVEAGKEYPQVEDALDKLFEQHELEVLLTDL